jgi:hypothetical protein
MGQDNVGGVPKPMINIWQPGAFYLLTLHSGLIYRNSVNACHLDY